jgi:hypothetical protein
MKEKPSEVSTPTLPSNLPPVKKNCFAFTIQFDIKVVQMLLVLKKNVCTLPLWRSKAYGMWVIIAKWISISQLKNS